jgi:hypothetical protein
MEDIRIVLSYIPLTTQNKIRPDKLKFENAEYKDRIESQDELKKMLEKVFEKQKKIDFQTFSGIVENSNSEICLYILIYLLESKPINDKTLKPYEGMTKTTNMKKEDLNSKMIASPSLSSKFSPGMIIQKSPSMAKRTVLSELGGGNSILNKLAGKNPIEEKSNPMLQYLKGGTSSTTTTTDGKNPVRKQRENLKNIEDLEIKKSSNIKKVEPTQIEDKDEPEKNIFPASKYHNQIIDIKTNKVDSDDEDDEIRYEGFLYKQTQTKKLKKLYFKLINRDLYCNFFFLIFFFF